MAYLLLGQHVPGYLGHSAALPGVGPLERVCEHRRHRGHIRLCLVHLEPALACRGDLPLEVGRYRRHDRQQAGLHEAMDVQHVRTDLRALPEVCVGDGLEEQNGLQQGGEVALPNRQPGVHVHAHVQLADVGDLVRQQQALDEQITTCPKHLSEPDLFREIGLHSSHPPAHLEIHRPHLRVDRVVLGGDERAHFVLPLRVGRLRAMPLSTVRGHQQAGAHV